MDKNIFKNLIITIGIGIIIIACTALFIQLLPFLIIGGIVIWLVVVIIRKIKKFNIANSRDEYKDDTSNPDEYTESESFDTSEAIDVDYKEIDKK